MSVYPKHDEDIYGWAIHTAQLLRNKKMDDVDFDHLIEEMDALGRSEKHELISRLSLVLTHLLKWQYQPNRRGHSWVYMLKEQRRQSKIHLRDNSSLKSIMIEIMDDAYSIAILKAAKETMLDQNTFPLTCPYSFDQILEETFYPEES